MFCFHTFSGCKVKPNAINSHYDSINKRIRKLFLYLTIILINFTVEGRTDKVFEILLPKHKGTICEDPG